MRESDYSRFSYFDQETFREYYQVVEDIIQHPEVRKMDQFSHHFDSTCFQHSVHVSYMNYCVCKKFGKDARAAARAGLLHDLFLYDWHTHSKETGNHFHGLTHPRVSLQNAEKLFELNSLEREIILRHMWPVTPIPPMKFESILITLTDKYSGLFECGVFFSQKWFTPKSVTE